MEAEDRRNNGVAMTTPTDIDGLIERLESKSEDVMTVTTITEWRRLCHEAAEALATLRDERDELMAHRDVAIKALGKYKELQALKRRLRSLQTR